MTTSTMNERQSIAPRALWAVAMTMIFPGCYDGPRDTPQDESDGNRPTGGESLSGADDSGLGDTGANDTGADGTDGSEETGDPQCANADVAAPEATIDAVFFGQSHLWQPTDEYFGVTGNRDLLVKAHVVAPGQVRAPAVRALVSLGGEQLELCLEGPDTLPEAVASEPGQVDHSHDDSFTATIPRDWVRPGLEVTVSAADAVASFSNLEVGAPTEVIMTMVDVHFFELEEGADYPTGWEAELQNNWPVASVEVHRSPDVVFPEIILPPDCGQDRPPLRQGPDEFQDGEQSTAATWNGALRRAAGERGRWSLYYVNIYSVPSGGQAGGYGGVGNGKNLGILNHELGHALSLPHWGGNESYPYVGEMHGIPAPEVFGDVHVGPTWPLDQAGGVFLPPIAGPNSVGGDQGAYKKDPMQGGGVGDQEMGYLMRPFSDFSVFRMRQYVEGHVVGWDEELGGWAQWDPESSSYVGPLENDGVSFPVERDVDVISIMAATSGMHPDVNLVYPPIGPYRAALIDRFDPTVEADRTRAADVYCPADGCDVSVRVQQGGNTRVYMLPVSWTEENVPACDNDSWATRAVNVPAADGEVTSVELLATPNAQLDGLPAEPTVLSSWSP